MLAEPELELIAMDSIKDKLRELWKFAPGEYSVVNDFAAYFAYTQDSTTINARGFEFAFFRCLSDAKHGILNRSRSYAPESIRQDQGQIREAVYRIAEAVLPENVYQEFLGLFPPEMQEF